MRQQQWWPSHGAIIPILLCAALSGCSYFEDWQLFAYAGQYAGDTNTELYFNNKSIAHPRRGVVEVWVRAINTVPIVPRKDQSRPNDEPVAREQFLLRIDCNARTARTISRKEYSATGAVVFDWTEDPSMHWDHRFAPGDQSDLLARKVC